MMQQDDYQLLRMRKQTAVWFRAFCHEYGLKYLDGMEVMVHMFQQLNPDERKQAVGDGFRKKIYQ